MNEYRDLIQQQKKNEMSGSSGGLSELTDSSSSLINTIGTGTTLNSILNISDGLDSPDSPPTPSSNPIDLTDLNYSKPQAITQSIELGGEDSKEVTFEEETKQLMSDDPWMQRKMAEKDE